MQIITVLVVMVVAMLVAVMMIMVMVMAMMMAVVVMPMVVMPMVVMVVMPAFQLGPALSASANAAHHTTSISRMVISSPPVTCN